MKNSKIKTMAYIALYVALYIVLKYVGNLIPFLRMPNGGSIELELIAVFIASYQLGWGWGICVGLLSWLISIVLGFEMYFVHPAQVILDYVGPLVAVGAASLLWPFKEVKKPVAALLAVAVGLMAYFGITKSWNGGTVTIIVSVIVAVLACAFTYWYVLTKKKFGIVIAMLIKYVFQLLSGVYFWMPDGAAAGSKAAWVFSAGYNLWYNLVTMIVCLFVVPMLIDRLEKANVKFKA